VHLHFSCFIVLQKQFVIPPLAHRQQRRAHNSEVTGSTHVWGIYFYTINFLQYF
jgi:hypothetical protein